MPMLHPFLLLVLAGFTSFIAVLLVVSLRCWGSSASNPQNTAATPEASKPPARKAA